MSEHINQNRNGENNYHSPTNNQNIMPSDEEYVAMMEHTKTGEAFNALIEYTDRAVRKIRGDVNPEWPDWEDTRDMKYSDIAAFIIENKLHTGIAKELSKEEEQKLLTNTLTWGDPESKLGLAGTLDATHERLSELIGYMASNTGSWIGNQVVVRRSAPEGEIGKLEPNWTTLEPKGNGQLRCISPDGEYYRDFWPEQLEEARRSWEAGAQAPEA